MNSIHIKNEHERRDKPLADGSEAMGPVTRAERIKPNSAIARTNFGHGFAGGSKPRPNVFGCDLN
jgi:hypothetical protein